MMESLKFTGKPLFGKREKDLSQLLDSYIDSEMGLLQKGPGNQRNDVNHLINCVGLIDLNSYVQEIDIHPESVFAKKIVERMENPVGVNDLIASGELQERLSLFAEAVLNKIYLTYEELTASIMYMTSYFCDIKECIDMSEVMKPALYDRDMYYVQSFVSEIDQRTFIVWTVDTENHSDILLSLKIGNNSFIVFSATLPVLGHSSFYGLKNGNKPLQVEMTYRKFHFRLGKDAVTNDNIKFVEAAEILSSRYKPDVVRAVMGVMKKKYIINTTALPPLSIN